MKVLVLFRKFQNVNIQFDIHTVRMEIWNAGGLSSLCLPALYCASLCRALGVLHLSVIYGAAVSTVTVSVM